MPDTSARFPTAARVDLLRSRSASSKNCESLPDDKANYAYAEGKWTVKEVIGHVADGERVFSYRLTRIARGDQTPLAGFDENAWAKTAPHRRRPMADGGRRDDRDPPIDAGADRVAGRVVDCATPASPTTTRCPRARSAGSWRGTPSITSTS